MLDEKDILSVKLTEVGHEKEINSICIAPNCQIIATGSQDKLIKVNIRRYSIIATTCTNCWLPQMIEPIMKTAIYLKFKIYYILAFKV